MSFVKTVIICSATISLYEYYKNNPKNKYVLLTKTHIEKSIEICPFLRKLTK